MKWKGFSPVLSAALGAVISYYCIIPLFHNGIITIYILLALAFIPVAVMGFFQALSSYTFPVKRAVSLMPVWAAAFSAGMALGIGAGAAAAPVISYGIPEDTVTGISGVLLDDPRQLPGGRAMVTLSLKTAMNSWGTRASARGEVTVFFSQDNVERLREFGRGTSVFAEGRLRSGVFGSESLHITQAAGPLNRFRTKVRMNIAGRFSGDPWEGLALALLLGIRDNLDTSLAAQYREAGCSYILALSGMHLAVLAGIISFLLKKPLGLRPAAITGACLIIFYCFLVGPLPSLYRAALMYLLGVLAVLGMLKRDPFLLLCMAFLLQLALAPQSGSSISFILSYLALAGILLIGNLINNIFRGTIPRIILAPLSASLGAFVATAPVLIWIFNDLRPVGIIAGLVLIPLTTIFMAGSLVWLCLGFIHPAVSFLPEKLLSFLYWLMEQTVSMAAFVPGVRAHPLLILAMSVSLVALLVWLDIRIRKKASRLEPFTV